MGLNLTVWYMVNYFTQVVEQISGMRHISINLKILRVLILGSLVFSFLRSAFENGDRRKNERLFLTAESK